MRRKVLVRPAILLALGALVAGCGDGGGKHSRAGDAHVLVSAETKYGMAMAGGGTVKLVGGCLGMGEDVVIWPHGTEVVQDDPLTIDVPGLGEVRIGQDVQIGGGMVLEHSSDNVTPGPLRMGDLTVPANCAKHDIFLAGPVR